MLVQLFSEINDRSSSSDRIVQLIIFSVEHHSRATPVTHVQYWTPDHMLTIFSIGHHSRTTHEPYSVLDTILGHVNHIQ